jgi:hypothetical protein
MSVDLETRLTELSVFASPEQTAGLPRGLFWGMCIACGFYSLMIAWWVGLLFLLLVYPPLYSAHRSDPAALAVWAHALRQRVASIDPAITRYYSVQVIR